MQSLQESVLSFQYVVHEVQTQAVKLGGKHLSPLRNLAGPSCAFETRCYDVVQADLELVDGWMLLTSPSSPPPVLGSQTCATTPIPRR